MRKVEIPAPEEYRDFKDFRGACNPDYEKANKSFTTKPQHKFKSLGTYFYWCWKQPEAEEIHAAFQAVGPQPWPKELTVICVVTPGELCYA